MKNFSALKIAAIIALLHFVITPFRSDAQNAHFRNTTKQKNVTLQRMNEIYRQVHKDVMVFDSCAVKTLEGGEIIAIAYGTTDSSFVKFAVLIADSEHDYSKDDTPPTTCTCSGNCLLGCDPEYLPTGKWICTECKKWDGLLPNCVKSVTAIPLPKK